MTVPHDTHFGPWRFTSLATGRLLTHESGYKINCDVFQRYTYLPTGEMRDVDGVMAPVIKGTCCLDQELVKIAIGHVERKPWVIPGTVARLRDAFVALGLLKQERIGRAA